MAWLTGLLNVLLILSSIFLILLILIQRGKGGGLAGAFGGVGGSSAFGTKAGDVFTKITIRTALVWFLLNGLLVYQMNRSRPELLSGGKAAPATKAEDTKTSPPAEPAPVLDPGQKVQLAPSGKKGAGLGNAPPVEVPKSAGPDAPLPVPVTAPDAKSKGR